MIRFVDKKDIDQTKWDNCIRNSTYPQVFGYYWYLDVCAKNWGGLIEDDYKAVFPLAYRSKLGVNYLYQPFFTRHFGLYSLEENDSEKRLSFLNAIPEKFQYIDICLKKEHNEYPSNAIVIERKYQQIDLESNYSDIRKRYSENVIRNLKKAEKAQLNIDYNYQPEKIIEQFKILQKEKNLGFEEDDFTVLRNLIKSSTENIKTECWATITPNGEVASAAYFMESDNRILYLKGFTSPEGKKIGAMHFLFDKLIQSKENNNLILDFGGSSDGNVARFYKSFGASDSLYLHLQINKLPRIIKWLKKVT